MSDCPICLETIKTPFITNCNHVFCFNCINACREIHGNNMCPLCRTNIKDVPYYGERIPYEPNNYPIEVNISNDMVLSGYKTISRLNKWKYLYDFKVNNKTGFMFCDDTEMNNIMSHVSKDYNDNHSGSTMAFTMRHLQFIAYYGFIRYKNLLN